MAESKSSPRRIEAAERRRQALRLRIRGASFDDIAEQVGLAGGKGSACRVVQEALAEIGREEAEELRALELYRLDELHRAVWSKALRGNLAAVDRVLKIMERRAKLCGLDEQTLTVEPVAEPGGGIPLRELFADDPQRALRITRFLHEELPMPMRPTRPYPTDGPTDGEQLN